MPRRTLNRRELRAPAEETEPLDAAEPEDEGDDADDEPKKKKPAKAKKPAAVKKPAAPRRKKVKVPARRVARWGVFDSAMKQLAVFDYNQRAEADQRVADLAAAKKGTFFLQLLKEPMPEPVAAEA